MRANRKIRLAAVAAAVIAGLAAGAGNAREQASSDGIYRVFSLVSQVGSPYHDVQEAFLKGLARYGYVEKRNLQVTVREIGNNVKKGQAILRDESLNGYDLILANGTAAALSARTIVYGKSQPVIFAAVTDPVGIGIISDFINTPKANFTGVSYPVPVQARLRFIRRLMPSAKTFGLIYADMPQSRSYRMWIEQLLRREHEFRDIRIVFRAVPLLTGSDSDRRMARSAARHIAELDPVVDAYIASCDQLGSRPEFSRLQHRMSKKPLIGLVKDDVMAGWGATAVMFPSHDSIGTQAAEMARTLFKGGRVSEIPPQWPQKFGFAVDLAKAGRFGIKVPVELLEIAGENIVR